MEPERHRLAATELEPQLLWGNYERDWMTELPTHGHCLPALKTPTDSLGV